MSRSVRNFIRAEILLDVDFLLEKDALEQEHLIRIECDAVLQELLAELEKHETPTPQETSKEIRKNG